MVDTWHDVGHTSNLSLSWDKSGIRAKRAHFLVLTEREEKRERGEPRLPPKIYGVSLVGFRRAKNESSPHRQGVRVGTRKEGFRRSSKRRDFGKSKLFGKEVRDSSYLGLLSIFGLEKEGFSVKGLFGKEK